MFGKLVENSGAWARDPNPVGLGERRNPNTIRSSSDSDT